MDNNNIMGGAGVEGRPSPVGTEAPPSQHHHHHPMDYYDNVMPQSNPPPPPPPNSNNNSNRPPSPHSDNQYMKGYGYGGYGNPPPPPMRSPSSYHHYPPPPTHHHSYMYGHHPAPHHMYHHPPPPPHYYPHYMPNHPSAPTPPHQPNRRKEDKKTSSPELKPLNSKPSTSPSSSDGGDMSPSKSPLNNETQIISVPPMRSDFYFFVQDHKESILQECKSELPLIYRRLHMNIPEQTDTALLFSHVNERLIALWEATPPSSRQTYVLQEEEDRKRFMNAEEVASQHCATLTARVKSPAFSIEKKKEREDDDFLNPISPTKKIKSEDKRDDDMHPSVSHEV